MILTQVFKKKGGAIQWEGKNIQETSCYSEADLFL